MVLSDTVAQNSSKPQEGAVEYSGSARTYVDLQSSFLSTTSILAARGRFR